MLLSTTALLLQLLATPAPQDQRLLRDARAAQTRFEGLRRMHLPRDRTGGSGGRCDAHIGRYCYWYDSIVSPAVPEPGRIAEARSKLLAVLDSAAARNPGDGWIAGQRIRYLIEAGLLDEAVSGARACRAEGWWCAALEGLSLHVAEQYSAADSAFAVALREMPAAQRCEWLDLSRIAPEKLARELSRASCDERAGLVDRLWVLGQPLWSTPGGGNDLRTEHFSRLTMASILARSANAYGMSWGDDSRELMVRYGWAEWFTRGEPDLRLGLSFSSNTTGHDREPSYSFFPEAPSTRALGELAASAWILREPTARTRYAPRHVTNMSALPHQLARFPRGDSMRLAVAYTVSDTALAHDSMSVAVGTFGGAGLHVDGMPAGSPISVVVSNDTLIVSVEVHGEQTKRAARARYAVDPLPCRVWCVSDILLFDPARARVTTDVEQVLPAALTDAQVASGRPLGVLWELQGTPGPEPVWIGLTVEPLHVGLGRRIATRLHLARSRDPVRLRWQAILQTSPQVQSVTLGLPASARGKYRVVLTIEPARSAGMAAVREIEVVR
jgi:hypothetical protein